MLFATLLLAGCKTTKPIYYYGEYPQAVYSYLKADETSASEQIGMLEMVIEKAANEGLLVAPGIHAQLGLLYFETGNSEQGLGQFEQEKLLFPESAIFLNYLLNNIQAIKI